METSVRTSGPVLSSNKPSLVQTTLLTGPPVELHVRENVTSTESISDVSWNGSDVRTIVAAVKIIMGNSIIILRTSYYMHLTHC